MLTTHLRRCNHFRHINGVVGTGQIGHVVTSLGNIRCLSKDKSCCPDTPQAEGKKVEAWPKPDPPPPAWRCECPKEPQPTNYDPYRIKVPDVVVPPIPSSNAKWTGVVFTVDQTGKDPPAESQEPAAEQREAPAPGPGATEQVEEEEPPSEGFFTRIKNMFGLGKRRKGEGDMSFEVPTEDGREPFKSPDIKLPNSYLQDLFHDSPIVHPDYWKEKNKKLPAAVEATVFPRLGYHGKSKYKYAFHEPWKPLDRLSLMAQAEKDDVDMSGAIEAAENTDKIT